MEDTNIELRSRSRSKTPFLRSSCDREHCEEGADHLHHKTGRKTPVKRSTPIKQIHSTTGKVTPEPIAEVEEIDASPAHRTRNAMKYSTEKLIKTSDYSSEESLDRLAANKREIAQNEKNYKYESEVVTTTTTSHVGSSIGDFSGLSPIGNERSYHAHIRSQNASRDKSSRLSPAFSACSTDSSFAEQALADASALLEDPRRPLDHLPYRLYQMAGEYWNKYPKTDFTYSPLSRDRVELAPGQVAVPNMSRRSLSQFRIQGPLVSPAEFEQIEAEMRSQKKQAWDTNATKLRRRYTSLDSSEDEGAGAGYNYKAVDQRWWLTRIIMSIVTTITETTSSLYHSITGPPEKYPYRGYQQQKRGVVSQAGALLSAPFLWVYSMFQKIVTNTITTVTETVTPNHVGEYNSYKTHMEQRTVKKKKSWWPWLLLLLIPLVGYGCYSNYEAFVPKDETVRDTYEAPKFVPDSDLSKRVAALENWATGVDNKFKYYDNKISVIDNIEARIESYSIKYLQNNLIQILDIDSDDGELLLKLKQHFDRYYMSKNDAQVLSQEVHERLMGAWKPEVDEDSIRKIVQEYLAVYEKEQMRILLERFKEFIKETKIYSGGSFDPEEVKRIVAGMLDVYDADKIGKVDYALESAGGQVISTKCTELYQIKTKQYSVLGVPVWWVYTSPRHALTPGALPAECWAFQGFPGYLVIRTYAIIEVTGFSMEHMSRLLAADGKIESAPKNFSVYGLRDETDSEPHLFGDYVYDAAGTAIQYFPVKYPKVVDIGGSRYPVAYDIVELRIESNHGNPTYTCVYRFRVHGNPLSDVREAAEDSMRGDGDS